MPRIKTKVDRNSDDFAANMEVNLGLARDLAAVSEQVLEGGSQRSRAPATRPPAAALRKPRADALAPRRETRPAG